MKNKPADFLRNTRVYVSVRLAKDLNTIIHTAEIIIFGTFLILFFAYQVPVRSESELLNFEINISTQCEERHAHTGIEEN